MNTKQPTQQTEDLALTPDLMDNRVIGHKTVTVETPNADQQSTNHIDTKKESMATPEKDSDQIDHTDQTNTTEMDRPMQSGIKPLDLSDSEASSDSKQSLPKRKNWFSRHKRALGIFFVVLFLIFGIVGGAAYYTYSIAMEIQAEGKVAATLARAALDNFKAQNLPATEKALKDLKTQVGTIESSYNKLQFVSMIPFANAYFEDGKQGLVAANAGVDAGLKAIAAITPYADVLGFTAEDATPEASTAANRVQLILDTLEIIMPTLDEINGDLEVASQALATIDPNRYPESVQGIEVRGQLIEAKDTLTNAQTLLADYRPILQYLPEIAGNGGARKKYLVLFQNDNELRPTGGFLTAYSVIFIENGVVTPEKSDDIYELDKKFKKRIAIPEALGRYLTTEKYFNLRDMNISPDFITSIEQFYENYQQVPGEPENIDGIIAVDTHVLTQLLKVVGPVEIAGYGTFSAENDPRCDCPQIIYALSEIITRPTPYIREDRKGILAPLMQSVLTKIYSSPRTFMADLFTIGLESIDGKHIQMYFLDENHQNAAKAINGAGEFKTKTPEGDFLAIVNANLGGAKSNLFVKYDVKQTVFGPENGVITKRVEITYRNPRRADNCNLEAGLLCLNSTLRDWTRIYVPEGSTLISAQGFTEKPNEYTENGFQVFDGFFILEPLGQSRLVLEYTVPYNSPEYDVTIWKQGGTDPIEHVIDVNGGEAKVVVNKDTVFSTPF